MDMRQAYDTDILLIEFDCFYMYQCIDEEGHRREKKIKTTMMSKMTKLTNLLEKDPVKLQEWGGYIERVKEVTVRLESARKDMEGVKENVSKAKAALQAYEAAHKAKVKKPIGELEKVLGAIEDKKRSAVRKSANDREYTEYLGRLEEEAKEIREMVEGEKIIEMGGQKIKDVEARNNETLEDIAEILGRLPIRLNELYNYWAWGEKLNQKPVVLMDQAISKANAILKRVEGTFKKEEGGKTGCEALPKILNRKLESWSVLTRDWKESPRVLSRNRTGEIDPEVLDIVIGSLLGDATIERTVVSKKSESAGEKPGCLIKFLQGGCNGEYIKWLHGRLQELNYVKKGPLKLQTMHQKAYTYEKTKFKERDQDYYTFRTFSYKSFEWIAEGFYKGAGANKIKVVPE